MSIRITLDNVLQRNDMSGRELERRTGVHRDTIGNYRHDTVRTVSLDILEAFCEALDCTLSDLLSDLNIAQHSTPRQGIHPPLPDGTPCPKRLEHMSPAEFDAWVDTWFDAWEQARGMRV